MYVREYETPVQENISKQKNQLSFWNNVGPAKPFLKWAGGKGSLLHVLRGFIPKTFGRYFEPFLGGGAMFFDLLPESSILSDSNEELINCYEVICNFPKDLIKELSSYRVSSEEFYRIRALNVEKLSSMVRAARLIYLNKTCYNGLYRVNRKGQFNTPFGHNKNVRFVDEENIISVSAVLQKTKIKVSNYDDVLLKMARPGDFIYLDPPYLPTSMFSDFKRYTPSQFYEADHERLADVFRELDKRGCLLLLSNAFHSKIKKLFQGYKIKAVTAPRFINCKGSNRGDVKELLVMNY